MIRADGCSAKGDGGQAGQFHQAFHDWTFVIHTAGIFKHSYVGDLLYPDCRVW